MRRLVGNWWVVRPVLIMWAWACSSSGAVVAMSVKETIEERERGVEDIVKED